ncbi:MAG TPA: serine/threonine-protein kinase, partial [Planctomycetota bacterium]|nr:serine/threonine-protein kinase [Planctomycetota bacterium]
MLAGRKDEAATEKIGTVIDKRYQITGLLGRGGMGSVYRAEHVRLKRQVALKLLHPEFGRIAELAKRFEREAFATGRIDHPNIVTVSDFGELEDGTLYLVMELLDGRSLADVLERERKLSPRRSLHITRHVLRGLGHAHKAGVVHRDIKPENVLLVEHAGDADFAKLLDFGIAKLIGEAADHDAGDKLTQAGV